MAAPPFDPTLVTPLPFDIYTDAPALPAPGVILPVGACNFVDLTPGANGARCGCRRFWSRYALGNLAPDQVQWCMCNHHACYHEEGNRDGQVPEAQFPGQENEKPKAGREPLSPVMDLVLKTPSVIPGMDFGPGNFDAGTIPGTGHSFILKSPEDPSPWQPRKQPAQQPGPSIPDTLSWGDFMQSQPDGNALPPIPAQCLLGSQTASVVSSAPAKYLKPFAGKGLNTLRGSPTANRPSPLREATEQPQLTTAAGGATQPAESFVFVPQDVPRPGTPQSGSATQHEPRAVNANPVSHQAFKNLSDVVSGHDQRLDRLETVSFSAPGHDECNEKHDHADLRITTLESRIEEVEKAVNDNGSVVSRGGNPSDDASVASFSTAVASRPTHSQELQSQVQSLQAQIQHLQSLMPSPSHPWEVEVVFLPFPLKRIWQDAHGFKNEPHLSGDEWTQLPMTNSSATLRSQSTVYTDWASPEQDSDWLLPKAFTDASLIGKRLRSRGLIRTVTVRGSDARSVNSGIHAAFGGVFRKMQISPRSAAPDPRTSTFLGLQSTWVPLRKVHKDSRLRFLSPAELMTPVTWNVQFLNSIMMRASEPRLFITHPEAYLQDFQAYETGWTWQRLKETPMEGYDTEASQGSAASEDCWSWFEQLDEAPNSLGTASHHDEWHRVSASPSLSHFQSVRSLRSSSPRAFRTQSPLLASRRGSRPPHIRTSSMPMAGPAQQSPASARRRIASSGQSRRNSPALHVAPNSAIMKRRTRSPSHFRFTPRWTASPSPMPLGTSDRQPPRGTTPFAYATPHSNAPLQEMRPVRGSSAAQVAADYASDEDPDYNIDVYDGGSDDVYEDDESLGSVEVVRAPRPNYDSQGERLPEDEVWPGLEDMNQLSDGENIDPMDPDGRSDASSQPSEYPSTQRAWPADENVEFQIHEDGNEQGHRQ